MNILDVIKKVGHKIAEVVSWPFKHAAQLAHILHVTDSEIKVVEQLAPATREALVSLVVMIEHMGPDVLAAVAAKGFDIAEDLKTAADLKGIFSYIKDTLFPTIEADYKQIVDAATGTDAGAAADPAPADQASAAPGLHNVVPA